MLVWLVGIAGEETAAPFITVTPAGSGLSLSGVYGMWAIVVLKLYPLCRWWAAVKAR